MHAHDKLSKWVNPDFEVLQPCASLKAQRHTVLIARGPKQGTEGDNGNELAVITYELRQLSASDKAPYESTEIADGFI